MGQTSSKKKHTVLTLCSAGRVGTATIKALTSSHSDFLHIKAGVRTLDDPASKALERMGANLVHCVMGDHSSMVAAMKGVHRVFLIPPATRNRVELVKQAADAAKHAGVKHLAVLSVLHADLTDTVYGSQFGEIEEHVRELGVPYTILRLPMFMENIYGQHKAILKKGTIYGPSDPDKQYSSICVSDIGLAAASILTNPRRHHGQTYSLVAPPFSAMELAAELSTAVERPVSYERVDYATYERRLVDAGIPDWHVRGIVELWKMIDADSLVTKQCVADFSKAAGKTPTPVRLWVERDAVHFLKGCAAQASASHRPKPGQLIEEEGKEDPESEQESPLAAAPAPHVMA